MSLRAVETAGVLFGPCAIVAGCMVPVRHCRACCLLDPPSSPHFQVAQRQSNWLSFGCGRTRARSLLRCRRRAARSGSVSGLHRHRNQTVRIQPRLHGEGSARPRVEREVPARSAHRGRRVAHSLGHWLSPAADLLPRAVERRRRAVAQSATAGAVPRKDARVPRSRREGALVVLPATRSSARAK